MLATSGAMWDWSEGLRSQECYGILFCCPINLHLKTSSRISHRVSAAPVKAHDILDAWLPSLSPLQASQISSASIQLLTEAGAALEEEQDSSIRDAMGASRLCLEAMTVAGIRFTGPHFLAGGSYEDPSGSHGKLTVLPAHSYASRAEDIADAEGRILMVSRIYETMSSRLNGRPRTLTVQRALKSTLESLTVSDPFARLYLTTTSLQHLLDLRESEAKLHVAQRLESICHEDVSARPSIIEVLLRSFSIREDYQRLKADSKPIAQRQAAAMEEWMERLIPVLESFSLQLLRRLLLRPVLTETLGSEASNREFWQLPLSRRESLWGEPITLAAGSGTGPHSAVVHDTFQMGQNPASTRTQIAA